MTAAVRQQLQDQGINPDTMQPIKGKGPPKPANVAQVERAPANTSKLSSQHPEPSQRPKNRQSPEVTQEQKRDARPRPRFAVATHDFGGKKFVAYGINEDQETILRQAAAAAGIQEQN